MKLQTTIGAKPQKAFYLLPNKVAKLYLLLVMMLGASHLVHAQTLLAGWDFQTTANGGTAGAATPNTPTTFVANVGNGNLYLNGTNGASTWTQAGELDGFGGSTLNVGAGMANTTTGASSLALVNSSANGKSIVFKINMSGYINLNVSYATRNTSTGFNTQTWEYSTDATNWSPISVVTGLTTSFAVKTLSTITGLDNSANAYVRLTVTGATNTTGNNRIDNVQFNATASSSQPVVTSNSATATVGTPFSYFISATGSPTLYNATGLPAGLTINTSTGEISGTPTTAAVATNIPIEASNGSGTDTGILTLTINKGNQVITFGSLPNKLTTDPAFALTATGGASGNPITYISSNTSVATILGNMVTILSAGTTTITASQAGDANYNAATDVSQVQIVNNASLIAQTITFNSLPNATYGDAPITLTATGGGSGNPVTYISSNTSVATISGNTLTVLAPGTTTVTASQAGNATYSAAADVAQNQVVIVKDLTVNGAIANNKPYDGNTNATLDLSAANLIGTVGLDVVTFTGTGTFASANVGTAISVSSTITLGGADAFKYSVTNPTLSADITQANQTISFAALAGKTIGDPTYTISATATSNLPVTFSSSNPSVADISGNTITIFSAGTTTITASQAGDANYAAAPNVARVLLVSEPILAGWDFQTTATGGTAINAAPGTPTTFNANIGTGALYLNGTHGSSVWTSLASSPQLTAFTGTAINAASGLSTVTTSPACLAVANSAANGKSMSFSINMLGRSNLAISYATQGTATGFNKQVWEYSTDSLTWTKFDSVTTIPAAFAAYNLATITALNNSANAHVRLTVTGASNATGNNRLDNIRLNATIGVSSPVVTSNTAFGTVDIPFNYTVAATNGPTSYSVDILPLGLSFDTTTGVISGIPLESANAMVVTITATNASGTGTGTLTLTIQPGSQTITFGALSPVVFGTPPFNLAATGGNSGEPVTYTSSNPLVASISGNVVTIVGAGSTVITASQAGNSDYNVAPDVSQTLDVTQASQTITFGPLSPVLTTSPSFSLSATGGASGNPITFVSSDPNVATISGNVVTIIGAGSTTITASQAGNTNFLVATNVSQVLIVSDPTLIAQVITFNPLPALTYGDAPITLSATGGASGNPITFVSVNPAVATIAGNVLTIVGPGSTDIIASQAGNATYAAAIDVTQAQVVNVKQLTVTGATAADKVYDSTTIATVTGGTLSGIIGTDIVSIVPGTANFSTSNAGVGISVLTSFTLNGADAIKYSILQPSLTATIQKATQFINFSNLPNKVVSDPAFALTATSSVGLPITYTSSNTSVATISGNMVTIVGAGVTNITASQVGDNNYLAAVDSVKQLQVLLVPFVVDVIMPQYMQGVNGSNNNRIPCAYYLTIGNLLPNATYKYINQVVNTATENATSSGAGNVIFANTTGSFVSTNSPSFSTALHGTFTTDANGSYSGWFINEPTANAARFTPGMNVNFRIRLNNGAGGNSAVTYLTTNNTVKIINTVASAGANNGTGLRGLSNATPKNFVAVYDNVAGTGRPISCSFVESDGSINSTSYSPFYANDVDGVMGAYGMIIPNTLASGIQRVEQRDLVTGNLVACAATDVDGVWPSGANTVNPTGGTSAIVFTATDADLSAASCGTNLNLTCFIQGFFDGVSGMQPVLLNQGDVNAPANACDSIDVLLKDAVTYATIASSRAQLNQNGSCAVTFTGSYSGSYYIAIQHRNAIETWSANPVSFATPNTSYNFSTSAAQAYNSNQIEVASGVFAFYSGDIVKDLNEAVELTDIAQLESDNSNFLFGVQASDINGDGGVDLGDFPLVEANVNAFIFSNHPL